MSPVEFGQYFRSGTRQHTKHLTIITAPAPARKVAVVAGKKVAKSAVRRNQLRRRAYAVLRAALDAQPYDKALIVVLKPPFATLSRQAAAAHLRQAIAEVVKSA